MAIDEVAGRQVADYRIESILGRGGQGVVYLAEHVHLGRKVALKLLVPEMAADPDFRRRFIRESQIAASLDHPNILDVYDGGEADGELYVAVRLVGGSDLAGILDGHDLLPPERVLDILEPVARALDFAHAHGMVHRDVKPGNILIEPPTPERDHEQVFLCDFGLTRSVRVTEAGSTPSPSGAAPTHPAGAGPIAPVGPGLTVPAGPGFTEPAGPGLTGPTGPGLTEPAEPGLTEPVGAALTQQGYFVGTPQYAAPEQVKGEALTGAADQYALACVLFECLTGRLPFSRDSLALLLMAHAMEEPPPVRSMRTELPVGLDPVLARGLAKEPSARYPSCASLVEAARAALRETARVFISYARQDRLFVEWLHGRLADRGRNTWVDWEGIPPSALWMAEIRAAIDSADAFVFVISPHSTESGSCREELAHAEASNKRIIPIMYEEVDRALLPTALAARNWVFLRPDDDVSAGMASLLEAIDVDPEWVGTHTRLLTRAREWAADGKKSSHCLRGTQLKEAEEWLENARGREPPPAQLHTEYILASRRQAARRQRGGLTGVAVAFLAMVVLAGVAFVQRQAADHQRSIAERQQAIAERQRAEARRQRDRAVEQSRLALSGGLAAKTVSLLDSRLDVGLLLGLEALRAAPTLDARSALLLGAQRSDQVIRYLRGDGGQVHSVSISPEGTTLASAMEDGTVILWDLASFQPDGAPLRGHTDEVMSVAFSPDGKTLASGSIDRTVILWDVAAHTQVGEPLRGHSDLVSSVAFSPDGKTLVSGSADGTVILWDVAGHRRFGDPLRGHKRAVTSVAFSPDGKTLASGSMDHTVVLWDVATHRQLGEPLRGHRNVVAAVAFSPDGTTLASASFDRTIILWDIATHRRDGAPLRGHRSLAFSLAFSPDGGTLASGSDDDTLILWDVATRERIGAPLRGLTDSIMGVAFTPDGRTVASGSLDGTVVLWDVVAHRDAGFPLRGHEGAVFSVAFSPDGATLATGGFDGTVVLWDVATRRKIGTSLRGHEDPVFGLAFSPDGETLASGSIDGTVVLWDVATRRPVGAPLHGHQGAVTRVAFSPDGTILAAAGADRTVVLWDVAGRRRIGALRGHTEGVLGLAFSPDGTKLATGSDDLTVIVWDLPSRRPIGTLPGHVDSVFGVAFSPDGRTLASGSFDHAVKLWDVASLRQIGTDLRGHTNRVSSVAFASGGTTLASAGADGAVILWDVATRRRIGAPLLGHAGTVFSLAVSPDGTTIASGNEDGTAILWPTILWSVDPSVDLEALCARVARNLTQDEWSEFVPGEPYHATCPQFAAGS